MLQNDHNNGECEGWLMGLESWIVQDWSAKEWASLLEIRY